MTTNPHDELQEAALNHLWMPTQDWSELAENGVTFMDEGDGVRIRGRQWQVGLRRHRRADARERRPRTAGDR